MKTCRVTIYEDDVQVATETYKEFHYDGTMGYPEKPIRRYIFGNNVIDKIGLIKTRVEYIEARKAVKGDE